MKQSLTQSLKLPLALAACGFALLTAGTPDDAAGPSIVVGSHSVLPGTTQTIQFNVSGGDAVSGLFLWDGQRYVLAGILSSSGGPVDGATGSATRLAPLAATLAAAVPEPAGLGVLVGLATLVLRQRRR